MTGEDASTREQHADDDAAPADPEPNHQLGVDGDSVADQQAAALTHPVKDQHHPLPATVDAMPDPTDTDHPAGEKQAAENSANESPA